VKGKGSYINEVDSLRALAVTLVVAYHAFPTYLTGGFIGVDVFFVISGFVITNAYLLPLIAKEKTLRDFYIARFRRLAPALGVVLALTSVVCVVVLQPDRLMAYGWSLLAQPLYLQNFVFWVEGDYFSGGLTKPLLHTWSLAVEEQFYILWAGLILVLRRYPKALMWVVIMGAIVSLAVGFAVEPRSPKTVFYHLPTRVWEFAFGILACLLLRRIGKLPASLGRWVAAPVAFALAMIILPALIYSEGAAFPGTQSLIACAATAVVLVLVGAQTGHPALFWMRLSPVLYVGRISYGFYLWHWPPLAIFYLVEGEAASPLIAAGLMLVALLGAVASYHFVEEPIRRATRLPSSSAILRFVGFSSVTFAGFALAILFSNGMIKRYPDDIQPFLAAPTERGGFRCGKVFALLNPGVELCPLNQAGEAEAGAVLILGDSHADVLKEMISDSGRAVGRNVYLASRNCDLGRFGSLPFCSNAVLGRLISEANHLGVTEVIAISYWEVDKFDAPSMVADIQILTDAGFKVRVMRRVPIDDGYDPRLRAKDALAGRPLNLSGISRAAHLADSAVIDRTIDQAVAAFPADKVGVLSPADYLCSVDECAYHRDGVPFYLDSNHLTFTGARELRPMFDALLGLGVGR
jgi:peptidoglycan/LPS O-acetylase OafA/YrhL